MDNGQWTMDNYQLSIINYPLSIVRGENLMKPKVIKTRTDYQAALAHLETLMDAQPGTRQEEELELFAVLLENYEQEHFPIGLPDPVEAIQFRMEQQG
jgi:HTH-type transcriptional regulator / antitoxin HigA